MIDATFRAVDSINLLFTKNPSTKGADSRKIFCSASDSKSDKSITNDSAVHFPNRPIRHKFSRSMTGAAFRRVTAVLANVIPFFLQI
jgi:hypothetical protein